MLLVVDANILFSAFLKKGLTRQVLLDRRLSLFAPEFLLDEFKKYYPELLRRSGLEKEKALRLSTILLSRIDFVEMQELEPYRKAAEHLTADAKDEAYIACALAANAELWSHDRHLRQPRIKCFSTKELAERLAKKTR
ncbi:MAG: PIN domain-containing protein [Candidatus Diapherotrites archaeon]|nr:PIN domain-containing protein [Candidatus Diapherotrites archaeon]